MNEPDHQVWNLGDCTKVKTKGCPMLGVKCCNRKRSFLQSEFLHMYIYIYIYGPSTALMVQHPSGNFFCHHMSALNAENSLNPVQNNVFFISLIVRA